MKTMKKLNTRPLKVYYTYSSNNEYKYQYFNFKGRRFHLEWFIKLNSLYIPKNCVLGLPDYIHGIHYNCKYYIEVINNRYKPALSFIDTQYQSKINIYIVQYESEV